MNEPDEGTNLATLNVNGIALSDHEIEVLRDSYQIQKLCEFHMLSDQLVSLSFREVNN
jgi:hypothetical protein